MNWRGAHVLDILHGNRGGRQDIHRLIRSEGRNEFGMIMDRVILDCRVRLDGLESEQLPQTIRHFHRFVALGVARTATRLDRRNNLDAIQSILTVNRRSGVIVDEFDGGVNLISGRNCGNAEGYCVHAGCLECL